MALIRVEDKDTGHKLTIDERAFEDAAFKVLKDPAVDDGGNPLPPEYHVTKSTKTSEAQK